MNKNSTIYRKTELYGVENTGANHNSAVQKVRDEKRGPNYFGGKQRGRNWRFTECGQSQENAQVFRQLGKSIWGR